MLAYILYRSNFGVSIAGRHGESQEGKRNYRELGRKAKTNYWSKLEFETYASQLAATWSNWGIVVGQSILESGTQLRFILVERFLMLDPEEVRVSK